MASAVNCDGNREAVRIGNPLVRVIQFGEDEMSKPRMTAKMYWKVSDLMNYLVTLRKRTTGITIFSFVYEQKIDSAVGNFFPYSPRLELRFTARIIKHIFNLLHTKYLILFRTILNLFVIPAVADNIFLLFDTSQFVICRIVENIEDCGESIWMKRERDNKKQFTTPGISF